MLACRYLQACEGMRTDIRFLDQVMMGMEWYPRQTMPHLVRRGIRFPSNSTLIGPSPEARKSSPRLSVARTRLLHSICSSFCCNMCKLPLHLAWRGPLNLHWLFELSDALHDSCRCLMPEPRGYTWRQFLKLNALERGSPIFCCGGWHGYPEKQARLALA